MSASSSAINTTYSTFAGFRVRRVIRQVIPLIGAGIAVYDVVNGHVTGLDLTLFAGMYVVTMFGFEAGFHRYFSHGAFQATAVAKVFLAITGTMFGAGSVLWWATMHRVHHKFSDQPGDPHSPLYHGSTPLRGIHGWWHAYGGFLMDPLDYDPAEYSPELLKDPIVISISKHSFFWYCVGIAAPGFVALAITGAWSEFVSGIVWGGLARIFCGRLASLSVQCFGHVWGSRPYRIPGGHDQACNNILLVPGSLGMGWHNNHHAFPYTYSNRFDWWQIDPAAWGLDAMKALRLIHAPKFPSRAALNARRDRQRSTR
jgi:stearoyl-CoA desaturase (delta-9 desaturase)